MNRENLPDFSQAGSLVSAGANGELRCYAFRRWFLTRVLQFLQLFPLDVPHCLNRDSSLYQGDSLCFNA